MIDHDAIQAGSDEIQFYADDMKRKFSHLSESEPRCGALHPTATWERHLSGGRTHTYEHFFYDCWLTQGHSGPHEYIGPQGGSIKF